MIKNECSTVEKKKETEFVSLRDMEMCSKLVLHSVTELSLTGLHTVAYSSGHVAERVLYSSHLFHYTHYFKDKKKKKVPVLPTKKKETLPAPTPQHPHSLITSS